MLDLSPATRISAKDAISHPYFVGEIEMPTVTELKISSPKVSSPVITESGSTVKK
jgi:hypothetical protein